jgi:hypothetical protein
MSPCLWLPLAAFGCLWLPLAAFGCLWLPLAAFGCLWLPLAGEASGGATEEYFLSKGNKF